MFVPECAGVILVHAWMMILLFGFLYPTSAILAVSSRMWENLDPNHKLHATLGKLGAISFVFGLGAAAVSGNISRLFKSPHSILGTVIMILTFMQTKIGFFLSVESLWKGLADFLVRSSLNAQKIGKLFSRRLRIVRGKVNKYFKSKAWHRVKPDSSDMEVPHTQSDEFSRAVKRRASIQRINNMFDVNQKDRMLQYFSTMQKVKVAHACVGTSLMMMTPYCIMGGWVIAYRDDWIPGEVPWYAVDSPFVWLFWYIPAVVLLVLHLIKPAVKARKRKLERESEALRDCESIIHEEERDAVHEEDENNLDSDNWKKLPTMSLEDFQDLCDEGQKVCTWRDEMLVIDVTRWIKAHPGGQATILRCIGKDISEPLKKTKSGHIHSERARDIAHSFAIARLAYVAVCSSQRGSILSGTDEVMAGGVPASKQEMKLTRFSLSRGNSRDLDASKVAERPLHRSYSSPTHPKRHTFDVTPLTIPEEATEADASSPLSAPSRNNSRSKTMPRLGSSDAPLEPRFGKANSQLTAAADDLVLPIQSQDDDGQTVSSDCTSHTTIEPKQIAHLLNFGEFTAMEKEQEDLDSAQGTKDKDSAMKLSLEVDSARTTFDPQVDSSRTTFDPPSSVANDELMATPLSTDLVWHDCLD